MESVHPRLQVLQCLAHHVLIFYADRYDEDARVEIVELHDLPVKPSLVREQEGNQK